MRLPRPIALALIFIFAGSMMVADGAQGKKKKKGEEEIPTQTLELPPDPPAAVIAETQRLQFAVAPLSAKGLLSQQVRDGLKALQRLTRGDQIVKLRAFVAGTGDLRRVQAIVSETFAEKRLALPALSVIQVGGLPLEGAQVVLEAVSVDKKPVNPNGLAFLSGQAAVAENPTLQVAPRVEKALAALKTAAAAVGATPDAVMKVTCFVSSLSDYQTSNQALVREFPHAASHIVQMQRLPTQSMSECEAVARPATAPSEPVQFLNPEGLPKSENYSQIAVVSAPRIALSGTQMAFRIQQDDVRLAFQRLDKSLESVRTSLKNSIVVNYYPLSQKAAELIRNNRFEFIDKKHAPASTLVLFEGLPSLDASFAVEAVAVVPDSASQ
jgi:enamine deaminase RidA (YjgF/YER057c/UK114 family)